jgi:hypothetical protein
MAAINYLLNYYFGLATGFVHLALILLIGWGLVSLYRSGQGTAAIILFGVVPVLDLGGLILVHLLVLEGAPANPFPLPYRRTEYKLDFKPKIGNAFENRAKEMGAGRCVAGDKISHAAIRSMMCCAVTGQGAGVAAAVSIKDNVTCNAVDIQKIQRALKKQSVRVF